MFLRPDMPNRVHIDHKLVLAIQFGIRKNWRLRRYQRRKYHFDMVGYKKVRKVNFRSIAYVFKSVWILWRKRLPFCWQIFLHFSITYSQTGSSQRWPSHPGLHSQVLGWLPHWPLTHPGSFKHWSHFSPSQPSKQLQFHEKKVSFSWEKKNKKAAYMQSFGLRHLPLTHSEVGQSAKIQKTVISTCRNFCNFWSYVFRSKLLTIPRSNYIQGRYPYNCHFRIRGAECKCRN